MRLCSRSADHQRARAGKIAQRLQRPLGLALLVQRQSHDDEDEAQQHQRLAGIAQQQVHGSASDQQQKNRFAHHRESDGEQAAGFCGGQLVVSVLRQAARGFVLGQARDPRSGLEIHVALALTA